MEETRNKNGLGLALSVRREKFWHFSGILWLSRACTRTKFPHSYQNADSSSRTADLDSGSTSPDSSLQQLLLSDRRFSLTVANSYLLTALRPCLSSSSSGLVGNLARKPFEWVSRQNKGILLLALTHTHRTNAHHCATSCPFFAQRAWTKKTTDSPLEEQRQKRKH